MQVWCNRNNIVYIGCTSIWIQLATYITHIVEWIQLILIDLETSSVEVPQRVPGITRLTPNVILAIHKLLRRKLNQVAS